MQKGCLAAFVVVAAATGNAGASVIDPFASNNSVATANDNIMPLNDGDEWWRNVRLQLEGDNLNVGLDVLGLLSVGDESFRRVVGLNFDVFTVTNLTEGSLGIVPRLAAELTISPPGPVWNTNLLGSIRYDFLNPDESQAFFGIGPESGILGMQLYFGASYNFGDKRYRGLIEDTVYGLRFEFPARRCRRAGSGLFAVEPNASGPAGAVDCDFDQAIVTADYEVTVIPLPASALLLLTALAGFGALGARRAA